MKKILSFILALCIICCAFAYATEIRQAVNEASWWEWFNALSSEEQACINFRPSGDASSAEENYPTETDKENINEFE